jgi:hypothetical protein
VEKRFVRIMTFAIISFPASSAKGREWGGAPAYS